jgi:hypothetical protein
MAFLQAAHRRLARNISSYQLWYGWSSLDSAKPVSSDHLRRAVPADTTDAAVDEIDGDGVMVLPSIKSAGVRPAPNLSRTKVGTGVREAPWMRS